MHAFPETAGWLAGLKQKFDGNSKIKTACNKLVMEIGL